MQSIRDVTTMNSIQMCILGDTLVSGGTGSQTWPAPQDVVLNVVYPKVGTGAIVTYVDILVTQVRPLFSQRFEGN